MTMLKEQLKKLIKKYGINVYLMSEFVMLKRYMILNRIDMEIIESFEKKVNTVPEYCEMVHRFLMETIETIPFVHVFVTEKELEKIIWHGFDCIRIADDIMVNLNNYSYVLVNENFNVFVDYFDVKRVFSDDELLTGYRIMKVF